MLYPPVRLFSLYCTSTCSLLYRLSPFIWYCKATNTYFHLDRQNKNWGYFYWNKYFANILFSWILFSLVILYWASQQLSFMLRLKKINNKNVDLQKYSLLVWLTPRMSASSSTSILSYYAYILPSSIGDVGRDEVNNLV